MQIGDQIGWTLRLNIWSGVDYVALTAQAAGTDEAAISGPSSLSDRAVGDIVSTLDQLHCGTRRLVVDEQGDPQLV